MRGEDKGDASKDEGAEDDLLCGSKRAIRDLIPAKERGDWPEDTVTEVTVVDEDVLENGVLTAGLLEEDVMVVEGFFREDRDGGGGKVMGLGRW